MQIEDVYRSEPDYLRRLRVEVLPSVPFQEVITWMSKACFNPVLVRPTFAHMHLVTPRLFETPAATVPLFVLDEKHVSFVYGPEGLELRLPERDPQEKIVDIIRRPRHYADVVRGIRHHLAAKHSHAARLRQLVDIVEQ
jgi:hypothetical protein